MNCLVDLTSAATGVSVRQMRGRSLRLDPDDPAKVASNWDIVCVAPRHAQGDADYDRFVRKHRHLHAPADDGTLEAGVGHVHPDLSPFRPPPARTFPEIARQMVRRAADRDAARARWRIGAPYEGHEVATLVLHARRDAPAPPATLPQQPPRISVGERPLLGGAGAIAAAGALAGAVIAWPLALVAIPIAGASAGAAIARARRDAELLPVAAPLDRIARAVTEAYVELQELRPEAAASLVLEPRASGYLRARLTDGTPEEAGRVTAALDALLGPVERPALPDLPAHRPARSGRRDAAADRGARPRRAHRRLARRPRRPRPAQGARRGAGSGLAPLARPRRAPLHPARGSRARGARRGRRAGMELRHAAPRHLGLRTCR